jgi:hypothetical protein
MKKNIRQNIQIAESISFINKKLPALKNTEVVKYSYHLMADDFRKGIIDISIWDQLVRLDFGDKNTDETIEFAESRGCTIEDEDFDCVVVGKNDPDNTWAYLKREGVSRAPLSHVTKLVLYYVRKKLVDEDKRPAISAARRDTTVEKRFELLSQIMQLMMKYDDKTEQKLAEIRRIVEN